MNFVSDNRPVIIYRSVILLLIFSTQTVFCQTVRLPFFDDFSATPGPNPNPSLWINGGTLINNSFAINQPSKYVATFDGRNANGIPYDYINQLAYGRTDSLTSRPIDLSAYTPADSLYLSFFWQAKGLGDLPDSDDTLMLSFRNRKNDWVAVWKQPGEIRSDFFHQQLLAITDTSFFHAAFQFRFETKGRQSGAFDTWNIDYIYVNKNRFAKDIYTKDIASTRIPTSYLKRFTAMPMRQYMVNPAAEVSDSLKAEVFNLQMFGNFSRDRWEVSDAVSGTVYYDLPSPAQTNLPPLTTEIRKVAIQPITNFTGSRAIIESRFTIVTTDADQPDLPGYDLSVNDSISVRTVLDDYYAYDDGSAEIGADFNESLGKVAIQYVLSRPDSIGAVRFNFSPYFNNPYLKDTISNGGQYFLLQILDSNKGMPGDVLHQQSIRVQYKGINHFSEYPLSSNISIKDTFYVAWTKITPEVIAVGVDKNNPQFADKIFYNNGSEWIRNTTLKGSLMVRPVIATKPAGNGGENPDGIPTGLEEPFGEALLVYPNPASDRLYWNIPSIRYVSIWDIAGREVLSATVSEQELDISHLPANIYFVKFSDGRKNLIRKIVVLH